MDIKSIFEINDKTKNPRVVYSQTELVKIMDYLYNMDFDFCLFLGTPSSKDSISGDKILVEEGTFLSGNYLWSYYDPMYVLRYGLKLDDDFLKQIEQFYADGNTITKKRFDWKQRDIFYTTENSDFISPSSDEPR